MSKKVFRKFLKQVEAKAAPYTVFFLMVAVVFTGMFVLLPQDNIVKADPFTFTMRTIDTGNITDSGMPMDIHGNTIGIVYGRARHPYYAYSTDEGVTWNTEAIDDSEFLKYQSLGFCYNSTGTPYVLTGNNSYGLSLYYKSGTWQKVSIDYPMGDWVLDASSAMTFNSTDDTHPHILCRNATGNYDLLYYYWSGSAWTSETVDSGNYAGRSPSIYIDGSDVIHIFYARSSGGFFCHRSKAPGGSWSAAHDCGVDQHETGGSAVLSNGTFVVTFVRGDVTNDPIYYDYSTDSGVTWHTNVVVNTHAHAVYAQQRLKIARNSTDERWIAWQNTSGNDVYIATSSDGASWTSEAVYTGNASNGNNAGTSVDIVIDSSNNVYIGIITNAPGADGDGDLVCAVYDAPAGPDDTPSSFTLSGYDATHFVTWTGDGGQTIWSNATSYGTLEINYNVNASDSLTDICINIDADDIDAGLSDENITVYVSFDGSTFAVLNDDIGNGAGVCANGLNLTINATTWPASDPGGDPNFPIDPVGTWENDTIYCRFTLAIPSGMSASTYSSVNTDWLVDYKVES